MVSLEIRDSAFRLGPDKQNSIANSTGPARIGVGGGCSVNSMRLQAMIQIEKLILIGKQRYRSWHKSIETDVATDLNQTVSSLEAINITEQLSVKLKLKKGLKITTAIGNVSQCIKLAW